MPEFYEYEEIPYWRSHLLGLYEELNAIPWDDDFPERWDGLRDNLGLEIAEIENKLRSLGALDWE